MFNAASKTSFTAAAAAFVLGFGAVLSTSDRVAFAVLVFAAAIAAAVGVAVFYFSPRDPVIPVSAEVEAATVRSIDVTDLPAQSPWPLLGAVAVTLVAVGAALGKGFIVIGLILAVVAAFAWLGQVWGEHPSWTQAMTDRIQNRFIVPIGLPGTILLLAGLAAVSLSRIFLAVDADVAPAIGIVIAFAILGAFYLLSTRESISKNTMTLLVAVAVALVIGAGLAGALKGEREFHEAGAEEHGGAAGGENSFEVTGSDNAFEPANLQLPAESEVVIEFHNEDDVDHTFSVYEDEGGDEIFVSDPIPGGETAELEFATPEAGTYYLQCDIHPDEMTGEITVTEDASAGTDVDKGTNPTTTSTTEP